LWLLLHKNNKGDRHSSAVELGDYYTPEEIMGGGTGHAANKAFNRYFKLKADKKKEIPAKARPAPKLHRIPAMTENDAWIV
jgi:hypothetical protein